MGRNLVFWLAIALVLFFLLNVFQGVQQQAANPANEISYSEFMAGARDGSIRDVTIKGNTVSGTFANGGEAFTAVVPPNENVVDRVSETPVEIKARPEDPDAGREGRRCDGLWEKPGEDADREARQGDV